MAFSGSVPTPIGRKDGEFTLISILVVEDSESDFEILQARLPQYGIEARLALVEDEAGMRARLAEGPWDLVISDHKLPAFSLDGALKVLREQDPDTPLIVLSGAIGEEAAVDAMLAGANDFIMKDNMARLPAAIRRAVASADSRRRLHRAESALRESEGLLRSLADNLPAMMLRVEYDRLSGAITLAYVGGAATQLLGMRPQELRARPELLLTALIEEDRAAFKAQLRHAADAGIALSWQGRWQVDGQERWIQVDGRLRERTTARAFFDCVVFDINGVKSVESEVRELTAHLEDVKERERASVAREIHDDIGALFFGLKVDLAWLRKRAGEKVELLERLQSIETQLDTGIAASHRIVRALRPAVLDYGVVGAAEWLARDFGQRTGMPCNFKTDAEDIPLASESATALFRVLQESLTNILRHAKASRVDIELRSGADEVALLVRDNGRGVGTTDLGKRNSFGVRGMRERARELGGAFELGPADGGGTQLSLRLPLVQEAAP